MKSANVILLIFILLCIAHSKMPEFNFYTEEWHPFNFHKNGEVKGLSADILEMMLKKVGSVQNSKSFRIVPWARALHEAKKKENSVLFSTIRTKEREASFKWVGPITDISFYFWALKGNNIKINSFDDFKPYTIGVLRNDATEELVKRKLDISPTNIQPVSANILNMRKLLKGRIDLITQSEFTTIRLAKENNINLNKIEKVFTLDKKELYYAFNIKTSDDVINSLQKAFNDLKKEGKIKEIFKRYGLLKIYSK